MRQREEFLVPLRYWARIGQGPPNYLQHHRHKMMTLLTLALPLALPLLHAPPSEMKQAAVSCQSAQPHVSRLPLNLLLQQRPRSPLPALTKRDDESAQRWLVMLPMALLPALASPRKGIETRPNLRGAD
jgi:hypothetical protein